MKVEILFIPGCPNHGTALYLVRRALEQEEVSADIVQIEVNDPGTAIALGFLGSPSIRINGLDVEPAARSAKGFGLVCRTCFTGSYRDGVPPIAWIRDALREAKRNTGSA